MLYEILKPTSSMSVNLFFFLHEPQELEGAAGRRIHYLLVLNACREPTKPAILILALKLTLICNMKLPVSSEGARM